MRKFPSPPSPPCAIHDRLRRKPLSIEILNLPTITMHLLYHVVQAEKWKPPNMGRLGLIVTFLNFKGAP
ncbi:hypothetical protein Peur_041883 [Populus x canadensis]